ncbi:hypothetical protein CARUB_v10012579mg [Capsella rubella]|uniref:Pentacotripeptide-repeat region of PRORP domain-containing protein n=1 Tax=Capsella rubella TaxID=81985 RepID=R0IH88_9BRAS|nr:hypothetical protein CARUB_v10012579mg [Capsella rubella]
MGEEKVCTAHLHLTETVLGLEETEKFFKTIPSNMRDYSVYSTLLTSYTRSEKTLDKAESTFKKMRELGFLWKSSRFNSMISLYSQLGKGNMVDKLFMRRWVDEEGIKLERDTVAEMANAYVRVCSEMYYGNVEKQT